MHFSKFKLKFFNILIKNSKINMFRMVNGIKLIFYIFIYKAHKKYIKCLEVFFNIFLTYEFFGSNND